jgi:hypothetical protein
MGRVAVIHLPDTNAWISSYAAVWVQRAGAAWQAFHGKSASDYQAFFDTWTAKGYYPVIITATGDGSNAIFAGPLE